MSVEGEGNTSECITIQSCLKVLYSSVFRERLSYNRGKAYATVWKVIMGNSGILRSAHTMRLVAGTSRIV